jgi:hypothetical protein
VLEQTLVQGAELGGGVADPIREGRAIELDALAGVDLALPIERQVVGVFADQDMGDKRLGRQPALDQARRRGCLDHALLAAAILAAVTILNWADDVTLRHPRRSGASHPGSRAGLVRAR